MYALNCSSFKEIWVTLEMIYEISPSIEQERMNSQGEKDECECFLHTKISTFINFGNNVRTFGAEKYLIIKN